MHLITASAGQDLADVDVDGVRRALAEHGAVWLRGLHVHTFEAFTERFGGTFAVHQSTGRRLVTADGTTQTVAPGTDALPLHRERAYAPAPPDVLFFRCVRPAATGGETTLCDGVSLAQALPISTRRALEGRRFRYVSWSSRAEWARTGARPDLRRDLRRFVSRDPHGADDVRDFSVAYDGGRIRLEHTAPCLPQVNGAPCLTTFLLYWFFHDEGFADRLAITFDDGAEIPRSLAEEIAAAAEPLTEQVAWAAGDVLVVDNARVMHGRRAFADPQREVHLRMLHLDRG